MRITQNPTLTGPFAALSPVAQTITPKPIANYAEEQQPTPRAPSQAPAAPQAGSILGLGLGQPTSAPSGSGGLGGLFDFSDPRVAIGWQMIANGARQPSEMFSGVPEAAFMAQRAQKEQMEEQRAAEQQNKTLEYLRANRPDLLPLAEAGYVKEAFMQAFKAPETNDYQQRAAAAQQYGIEPGSQEYRTFILTGDLPAEAKPTEFQMREAELARQGIDPASPEGRAFILSGKYAEPGAGEGSEFKPEQDLRKEYRATPEYKRYDEIRASYERIRSAAQRESGAADLGVIFSYMKMLDPGSVVREGEFANAQNSSGVPDQVRNMYNRVVSGERLTPEQRAEFVNVANDLYANEVGRIEELNRSYGDVAGQYGLEPSRVVVEPRKYEPLKVGQTQNVTVNGANVTIKKVGQ